MLGDVVLMFAATILIALWIALDMEETDENN